MVATTSLVSFWPALSTISVDVTQALGSRGPSACRLIGPEEDIRPNPIGPSVNAVALCFGDSRCGRTQRVKPTRTAMNAKSVVAMAGNVRRTSTPTVRPRAKAKAAYPIGTIPRSLKMSGCKRLAATCPAGSTTR